MHTRVHRISRLLGLFSHNFNLFYCNGCPLAVIWLSSF